MKSLLDQELNGEVRMKIEKELVFLNQSLPTVGKSYDRQKIYYGFLKNYSSENTRKAYMKDLKEFLLFITENFKGLSEFEVEHSHIVAFKEFLINNGGDRKESLSHRTINRKLACLGAFYEYLFQSSLIDVDPTTRVRRFRIGKEIVTTDLSDEQVKKLLNTIDTSRESGLLHKALVTTLFNTGMRHGEITNLRFKNLVYDNEFVVFKYIAKGEKEMVTPVNDDVMNALGLYFEWCQKKGFSLDDEDYIFRPTKNPKDGNLNKKLDSKSLDYIIKKYAAMIGIKGNITVHSARSTVIGKLLDSGMSIDRVADFVGHRDLGTTKGYNKRKRKVQESPAFGIKY